MSVIQKLYCALYCLFALLVQSQELPPIQVFSPQDYNAEDQNWAITQAQSNFIYAANNAGLLEYDGEKWTLYKSPNNDILRSVNSVGNRIYTGGYMDFGFWQKNNLGKLMYTSLVKENELLIKDDEEFWDIISFQNYILFQSFERIYIYNKRDKHFDIINSKKRINKIFAVNQDIYFQKIGEGVFKIENGQAVLMINLKTIGNFELVNIFSHTNGLLLQTEEHGFYTYINGELNKWNTSADPLLSNISVYNSIRLQDGGFVLGTISRGVILLHNDGSLNHSIDQNNGLSNNTVLSLKEDSDHNIWLGLDNGIDVVNLNSNYKVFKDQRGVLGTVYASVKVDDYLYLGTNQGLFYKHLGKTNTFKFIEGSKGQVWTLAYLNGTLFCGHDKGTFTVKGSALSKICSELGTWTLKTIVGKDNLLLQGNYDGLNVLEFSGGLWKHRNKLLGYGMSSRFIEFYDTNKVLVNHEYKGVYKLHLDSDFRRVIASDKIQIEHGVKSSLVNYNRNLMYCYRNGVFGFDKSSETFKRDTILSHLFSGETYVSGRLIYEKQNNKLWGFTKDNIISIQPGLSSAKPEIHSIEIAEGMRKIKAGFENLIAISHNQYLMGNSEGYIILDAADHYSKAYKVHFNEASYTSLQNEFTLIDINTPIHLKNKNNSIQFSYSVPNYNKLLSSKYQYKLDGIYDNWSDWSTNSEVLFENLPHGNYEFKLRAKVGAVRADNILAYKFSIEKPWYLKPLALAAYLMSGIASIFLIHYYNKKYYKAQRQKLIEHKQRELELKQLETQRELVQFKNKNLKLDIENKNRELGSATMNLVKRNELLNSIKSELAKSKSSDDIKRVIRTINSSLNSTNDWKLFEEAFNNVDKDFMQKVKLVHPSITPNDLRLCAYLRLNLSSKEIAPLLNISHKSVEVKRYRLRKKMGLEHNQSLADYILKV